MKRILLITETIGSGGAERQMCGLATMLTEAGYPCRMITYIEDQFYLPYLEENNVDYQCVPSLANKFLRVPRLVRYLREYRPDTIISFLPHVNKAVCLARMFYKCSLIVSERNNNMSYSFGDRIQFMLYRLADYIVPNSYCQADFIRNHCPWLRDKVVPIVNFVDTGKFVPSDGSSPKSGTFNMLTFARFTEQKNCLTYLKAVAEAKAQNLPVHFDWYGRIRADSRYYELVVETVRNLNIGDCIGIHDQTVNTLEIYQSADAFCLPSIFEGYPNVILEAMSCGVPVICSDVFENPEIVRDGVNGFLFNPYDVNDILSAIRKVLSLTEEDRRRMGESNRNACIGRNSMSGFAERYMNLIESEGCGYNANID